MNELKKDILSLFLRFDSLYREGKNYEGTDMILFSRKELKQFYAAYKQIIQKHDLLSEENIHRTFSEESSNENP